MGLLETFIDQEDHAVVSQEYKTKDGYRLGSWVSTQRKTKDKLTLEQIRKLNNLGFVWDVFNYNWKLGFSYLKKYYESKRHKRIPRGYITEEEFKLDNWVGTQRKNKNNLSTQQITRLDSLGFDWNPFETKWNDGILSLKEYINEFGHANVPQKYKSKEGYKLGNWIGTQRKCKNKLSQEQISKLEALGLKWTIWNEGFSYLENYVKQTGHTKVPSDYQSNTGFNLGYWVGTQRSNKDKLTLEKISKLDSLDFDWNRFDTKWKEGFFHMEQYVKLLGHSKVIGTYKSEDCFNLGIWAARQREKRKKGELELEQISMLDSLVFDWDTSPNAKWEKWYSFFKNFVEQEGHSKVPAKYITTEGDKLGSWVSEQRKRKDNLSPEKMLKLDALGFIWKTPK